MKRTDRSLWLGVGIAFTLLLGVWVTFFSIAARHRVPEVKLEAPRAAR